VTFHQKYAELRKYLKDLSSSHPQLRDIRAAAFPYWFAQAVLIHPDDQDTILRSLVGGSNDKNVDLVAYNDSAREVYLCQTKCRDALFKTNEKPNDLIGFAKIAGAFTENKLEKFHSHFPDANAGVRERLSRAWTLVHKHDYKLQLFYVTTGKVGPKTIDEARKWAMGHNRHAHFVVYDGRDCCRLFEDFQSLVPAIPHIEFSGVRDRMSAHSADKRVSSVVYPAPAIQIREVFRMHGERLFARNVRLDKGEVASVNRQIAATLKKNPKYFLYFNNGITILGRSVEVTDDGRAGYRVRVFEPQIINGQQTTRTIGRAASLSKDAQVLVRVLCRQPESDADVHAFRDFIATVVRSTNSQTKVLPSELAANNPEQIEIEQAFKRLNWRYQRKLGRTDDGALQWYGQQKPYGAIRLKELATALVCCLHSPSHVRQHGIEAVFDQANGTTDLYRKMFHDRRTPQEYLLAYLVLECAGQVQQYRSKQAKRLAGLGQYFVAHRLHLYLWSLFKKNNEATLRLLSSELHRRRFDDNVQDLKNSIEKSWQEFYKKTRKGDEDPLAFVSSLRDDQWQRFWSAGANKRWRSRANKTVRHLEDAVRSDD
jgi:hypothetical protein